MTTVPTRSPAIPMTSLAVSVVSVLGLISLIMFIGALFCMWTSKGDIVNPIAFAFGPPLIIGGFLTALVAVLVGTLRTR